MLTADKMCTMVMRADNIVWANSEQCKKEYQHKKYDS